MKKELFLSNPLLKLCFDFSLMIIEYCELLDELKKYTISRQLLKAGTSIGANSMEAQNAESKADFIHKLKIAAKESEESQFGCCFANIQKIIPIAAGYNLRMKK